MKKLFVFAIAAIAFTSCNKEESYTINGKVTGFEDGTKVYISSQDENANFGLAKIDSTEIKDGKFVMKGAAKEMDLKFIEIGGTQEFVVPFIYENGTITFDYNKEKPEDAKVTGTKNNDYLANYNVEAFKVQKELRDFQTNNMAKIQQAQMSNDEAAMEALMDDYEKISDKLKVQSQDFVKKHKDAFISLILLEQLSQSKTITTAELETYFKALDKDLQETPRGKKLAEKMKELGLVEIGKVAPDFSAPNPEGKTVSLKESLGKVTIIDFWASWCGPCRQENPNVVKLYNQYKDQGLAIIGVSLDKDADAWKKAITDDQLAWTQISNVKFWQDPIAKQYGISSIPATFILDSKGVIVAKDLRGAELEAKVAELLK